MPKDPIKNDKTSPFEQLINSSTKAIFLIEEKEQIETPLQYQGELPSKIVQPTKIDLKLSHLAPESPAALRRSSSVLLTDEFIFDFQFAESSDIKEITPSMTALKLERVVRLALKAVNQKLSQTSDHTSRICNSDGDSGSGSLSDSGDLTFEANSASDYFNRFVYSFIAPYNNK